MRKYWILLAMVAALGCGEQQASDGAEKTGTEAEATAQAATPSGGSHALPGNPQAGQEVYGRICSACHGADGRGNGGITGADFIGDAARLSKPNDVLLASIRDGVDSSPPMPPQKGILSEQEMKDALSYIRAEFGKQATQ